MVLPRSESFNAASIWTVVTTGVVAVVALAVALQTALARYAVGTGWSFDLVLVAVVYAALRSIERSGQSVKIADVLAETKAKI